MVFIRKNILIFLGLLILYLLLLPTFTFAQDVVAYIGEVGGVVNVTRGNPKETLKATVGMFLLPGDFIKTGEKSYMSIIFQDDGSRVKLDANTQLTLNATRDKKNVSKKMAMDAGKLFAKVTKTKGTDFQVSTPTSVASVKGTKFIIEEKEGGETWVWVLEDFVELSIKGKKVNINEGQLGKATEDSIDVEDIEEGEMPVEPGKHTIIFYFKQSDNSLMQRELHIEFER